MNNSTNKQETVDPIFNQLFEFKVKKGDLKKIEIIKAAIDCIGTMGVEKTTYDAIAEKIETRRAHVAYHYKDKNQIFYAAIRYIMGCYQQVILDGLSRAKDPKEKILNLAKAPFTWAMENPQQLSVMFLLYYYCGLKSEYRELNTEIRESGRHRIKGILQEGFKLSDEQAYHHAWFIQNLITGVMTDAATTNSTGLEQSQSRFVSQIETYLEGIS